MRKSAKKNTHLNQALKAIARAENIFLREGIYGNAGGGYEVVEKLCVDIESESVRDFLLSGLYLVVEAHIPEYIDALLDARLLYFASKGEVSPDEVFAMSLVKASFTTLLQAKAISPFLEIVSNECEDGVRDEIFGELPPDYFLS